MIAPLKKTPIFYPSSDGKRMADNTLQWDWMVAIKIGIMDIFRDDPNVFIAGDLLWYPVEGEPGICAAPDVMVAFGRPKGPRGSYKQWEEGGVAPQVVFEILSESNTRREMVEKLDFYREHGVEEYYEFDPLEIQLTGFIRHGEEFRRILKIGKGWISPRLGVHFKIEDDLVLTKPNGEKFPSVEELNSQRAEALEQARLERERADAERQRADALAQEVERLKTLLANLPKDA